MTISDKYILSDIIGTLETVLQIDGRDYGEREIDTIMNNIYNRIQKQYQLDLRDKDLTDDSLYIGPSRESAVLLMDNVADLHAKLSGYILTIQYKCKNRDAKQMIEVRGRNVNYFGASPAGFRNFCMACKLQAVVESIGPAMDFMCSQFGTISKCLEKRLLLIMIVSRKLGLHEIVSCLATIFAIGEDV